MRGHEEASGVKYVPKELFEEWAVKDPLLNFEKFLKQENILDDALIASIRADIQEEIDAGVQVGFAAPAIEVNTALELQDVYKKYSSITTDVSQRPKKSMKMIQAISEGIHEAMKQFPSLILMGQDIAAVSYTHLTLPTSDLV